jgi:3-(3-hydroxy-phenyl)propionate hydroxylase
VQVAIVGAGPVGLCAALNLARHGVRCRVLERETAAFGDLRASTFHPPTLDMLETLDLTAAMLAGGLPAPTWQVRLHETHERAVFDLGLLAGETRHPYRLQFEQAAFCALALERARAQALISIERGVSVNGLSQNAAGVTLSCAGSGADGIGTLRADYVIAADGANSAIRRALGLSFEGLTYPEVTVLATTRFRFEDHLPDLSRVNYIWREGGNFSLLRLPDRWRVSVYPDADEDPHAAPEPERIEAKLQRIVPRTSRYDVLEMRPYRIHQRIVPAYRVGRVLLAGDAAHVNSPTGGMGMNCGIHDAFNLSDKLAAVIAGEPDSLLDLYDRQRRPIARDEILGQANENRARMRNPDAQWRRRELERLQSIAADPQAARQHLLRTSMIDGLRRAAATN